MVAGKTREPSFRTCNGQFHRESTLACRWTSTMTWHTAGKDLRVHEKTATLAGTHLSMFARATVYIIFLIAKVWYAFQVICMSKVSMQKFTGNMSFHLAVAFGTH